MKLIFSLIVVLSSFSALATDINITPLSEINTPQVITTGIPFSKGLITKIEDFKLFDDSGAEVQKFIKPTLFWFDSNHNKTSIRAVKIQFKVESLTQPLVYSFDVGSTSVLPLLAEVSVEDSFDYEINKSYFPKVIATLSPSYLETAGVIPPFSSLESNDFYDAQITWAKNLNYSTSTIANWLFDRTTALYKGCMRTGDVSCYKEAFMSYTYWMTSLKREGDLSSCKGGSLLAGEPKNCDSKYAYTEQIKIHVALTGDDSQFDNEFVNDIAALRDETYYQASVDDPYDVESESFTERAAGIILLTQINAYEITGDPSIYENILKRINVLYDHQNSNPDGFAVDGSWRHSWSKHEGSQYPGDGVVDDKRFSPWMTENIVDSLWQAFQLTDDPRIPTMIKKASRAIVDWGFTDSQGYILKYGKTLEKIAGNSWHLGCNVTKDTLLYSATSVGSAEVLISTQDKNGFYSDTHNAEAIFMLSLGYLFEDDESYKELIRTRIDSIRNGYLNAECGSMSNTPRMFNWSNRSNYWGTYNWVLKQNPELLIVQPGVGDNLTGDVILDFSLSPDNSQWENPLAYESTEYGANYFNGEINLLNPLELDESYQLDLLYMSSASNTLDFGLIINQTDQGFYSVRIKSGEWGGVHIYKHNSASDISGVNVASKTSIANNLNELHKLTVIVEGSVIDVGIDGEVMLSHDTGINLNAGRLGVLKSYDNVNMLVKKLIINQSKVKILKLVEDNFSQGVNDNWNNQDSWKMDGTNLVPNYPSRLLTNKEYLSSQYTIKSDIVINSIEGNLLLGVVFGSSEKHLYTLKIKGGEWGGVFIYRLDKGTIWDVSGTLYDAKYQAITFNQLHTLKLSVSDNSANIIVDEQEYWNVKFDESIIVGTPGYISLTSEHNSSVANFHLSYLE